MTFLNVSILHILSFLHCSFLFTCLLTLKLCLQKKNSDAIPQFDQVQVEKTDFTIVFYIIHLKVKLRNRQWYNLIFLKFFLSPKSVMAPKHFFWSLWQILSQRSLLVNYPCGSIKFALLKNIKKAGIEFSAKRKLLTRPAVPLSHLHLNLNL